MKKILVCLDDGLLKIRIQNILIEHQYAHEITNKPIRRDDLYRYSMVVVHTSYKLSNLYQFIENAILQKLTTIVYLTQNTKSNPFRRFYDHPNLVYVEESKMDVELPMAIQMINKYHDQIEGLMSENKRLKQQLEENLMISKCKRHLIQKGLSEDEAHQYILKFAMDHNIDKLEACHRLLEK